jgi:hypothetical protein
LRVKPEQERFVTNNLVCITAVQFYPDDCLDLDLLMRSLLMSGKHKRGIAGFVITGFYEDRRRK